MIQGVGSNVAFAFAQKIPPYKLAAHSRYESVFAVVRRTLELFSKGEIDFLDRDVHDLFARNRFDFLELEIAILKEDRSIRFLQSA